MKISTGGLFVVVLIVMSFIALPVVFAGTAAGPGYSRQENSAGAPPEFQDMCTTVVAGDVTWVSTVDGVIVVSDEEGNETTVNGVPLWLNITIDDYVVINCRIRPDGKYVACYLTVNDGAVIELR